MALTGRVAMSAAPLSAFTVGVNGNDPVVPKKWELAYDDISGSNALGVIKYLDEVSWEFVSQGNDNLATLTDMDTSGIMANAMAAAIDKELTFFIFDLTQKIVRLNYKLVYPETYKYYAIKSTEDLPAYITGHVNTEGDVISYLIDMDTIPAESGSGNVSHPAVGTLLPSASPVDGDVYIVEFYNIDQVLIGRDSFRATAAKVQDLDMTPDMAVTGLSAISDRPYDGDPDACFLYQNESTDVLGLLYLLHYSDGSHRDVTHEEQTGGKLVITGLDGIDSSIITPDGQAPPEFTATYNLTPADGLSSLTVTKVIKVYIKEDIASDMEAIIPVYWDDGVSVIEQRFFGLFAAGYVVDIGGKIPVDGISVDGGAGSNDNLPYQSRPDTAIDVEVHIGSGGQTVKNFNFKLKLTEVNNDFIVELTHNGSYAAVDNEYRVLEYRADTQVMLLDDSVDTDVNDLTTRNTYDDGEGTVIVPTHFRIRNIDGTAYFVPGIGVPLSSGLLTPFSYVLGAYPLTADPVVLVEFMKVDVGGGPGGEDVIEFVTNARPYYLNNVPTLGN